MGLKHFTSPVHRQMMTQNVFVIQFAELIVFVKQSRGSKRSIKYVTKNSFLEEDSMFSWTEINTGKGTSLAFLTISHCWIGCGQSFLYSSHIDNRKIY